MKDFRGIEIDFRGANIAGETGPAGRSVGMSYASAIAIDGLRSENRLGREKRRLSVLALEVEVCFSTGFAPFLGMPEDEV